MTGEGLVRAEIRKLNDRLTVLKADRDSGRLGPRVFRARHRFLKLDFAKLECLARRYGFKV